MPAPAYTNKTPLTKQILAVLIHVRSIPEEIALIVNLVEDRKALRIRFRLAVESTLNVEEKKIISTCKTQESACGRLSSELPSQTHQAHGAIADPVDLRSVLAEFGGGQLAGAGDFADGFFDFVHGGFWCVDGCL